LDVIIPTTTRCDKKRPLVQTVAAAPGLAE
jgi:hypothetical protein